MKDLERRNALTEARVTEIEKRLPKFEFKPYTITGMDFSGKLVRMHQADKWVECRDLLCYYGHKEVWIS